MNDHAKTSAELIEEISSLKQKIQALEQSESKHKRAEEALRKSEEKYRSLFNQSTEGIYLHDLEGRILDVNERACAQSGYSREEWLGLTVLDGHPCKSTTNQPKTEIFQAWSQWAPGQRFVVEGEHQRKIPFLSSGDWLKVRIILFTGFQDSKDNVNQCPHNRADNHFPVLAFIF
jgi:PAS domain-containing protein